ncbi:MAG TPA: NUDIX domain-containing protein [Nevskiaceae bacterium]|nr:NUDIX domain-containing protein [Nevskiaceae bacterium]
MRIHHSQRFHVVPAVYVIFRDGDKVLLLKRANTGYRDGEYSMPSGHVDGGEPAVVAAAREAKEEVGVTIDPTDLKLVHTQHRLAEEGDHERISLYFEATKWQGEPVNAEPHKCSGLLWADMAALPKNLVPELQEFLRHWERGSNYGHFGF